MADALMPRLLYLSDVQVESSQHGSALMFRAFETYPADRLRIVETSLPSQAARRLPGVAYANLRIGRQRWLDTRLHGLYSAWLTWRAASRADQVMASLSGFDVEAVATVGHGFGWITAAEVARRLRVPLHVIVHDDWPRLSAITGVLRPWLERTFGRIYRSAASRLCVSPFMAEEYAKRYGAAGSVMYPSRSKDCPVFEAKAPRQNAAADLVIGYGGNSGPEMMACLRTLAAALNGARARLAVFGPFGDDARQELLAISPAITFHGFVPFHQMIRDLREIADVLFVPMTFADADRDNQSVSFPSKLADYTATGLPLLIYGPGYSSVVRWARSFEDAAEIVDREGAAALRTAITRLAEDRSRRATLAERAVTIGRRCFDAEGARSALATALAAGRA
jgi:hypothetical protein